MKNPTFEEISFRAYQVWEGRGRPDGQDVAIECWLQAEKELWQEADRQEDEEHASNDDREFQDTGEPAEGIASDEAEITNLDRALPADKRRQARNERRGKTQGGSRVGNSQPREDFIVLVNRGHVRIYHKNSDAPAFVSGFDLPRETRDYTDNDTDQAGRFPGSHGGSPGGSIDERLPMQEEQQRRVARESARYIASFLEQRPNAHWDFAAGPALHKLVLDELDPRLHARLGSSLIKDLINVPLPELMTHFEPQRLKRV